MFDHRIPYSKSRSNGKIFKRLPNSYRKYEVRYGRTDACAGDSGSMLPDIEGKKIEAQNYLLEFFLNSVNIS